MNYEVVWHNWTTSTGSTLYTNPYILPETEDQRRRRLARELGRQEQFRKEAEERRLAEQVAEELLASLLSQEQQNTRRLYGYFDVVGADGNSYRIHRGTSGNVQWIDDEGDRLASYCAHPQGYLPEADVHVAQMLALQADPDAFFAQANIHGADRNLVSDARQRILLVNPRSAAEVLRDTQERILAA